MKHLILIAAACLAATAGSAETYRTGLAELTIADETRPLTGFVRYPTQSDRLPEMKLGSPVWDGIGVVEGAAPAPGAHPLVVLSHGMYGNAANQAWLADALAQRGYVVAAVNHPGTSTWGRDPDDARQLWERPRDVSRVIDQMLMAPVGGAAVDPERVFMAGHSLGGMTAVALAGGRYDPAKADAHCAGTPADLTCDTLAGWHVGETPADEAAMSVDLSDPRIRGVAVFDLGGTQTFSTASLAAISRQMLVIGAPRDVEKTGLDLDAESRTLAAALPKGVVTYLEPETLSHFDFLGLCTRDALEILREEEPDDLFVCTDGRAERRAEHAAIVDEVDRFFAGL